jgi:hypothetical protein
MTASRITGGCQCGAVRFAVEGPLGRASICHCRMCQKAFGSLFGPLVSAPHEHFAWPREAPAWFRSSNLVRRGFCAKCGTPLAYDWGGPAMELAIGAFDNPEPIRPTIQVGLEHKLSWFGELDGLPTRSPDEQAKAASMFSRVVSYQHPDHDT